MIQEVLTIQFTYLRDTPDPRTHNQGVLLSPQEKQVFQHFLL